MNGLRNVASTGAIGPFRHIQRSSFRIMGAAKSPTFHNTLESDGGQNFSKINGTGLSKQRPYSHFTASQTTRKPRSYWSALAAGLLGIGGGTFVYKNWNKSIFSKTLIPVVAHCAECDDKADQCVDRKCDSSECLRKTDREEELIQKANAELERALRDTKGKAIQFTEAALKAYCDAIDAIKLFMNKVYCAVEEENLDSPRFEEVWCDVYSALVKRCDLSKAAMEKGQCAWELLRRLREVIENGKACKYTSCNPLLVTAEETLVCAEKELCDKKATMDGLLKESRVVEQYRNLVEEFRRDLKAEADSLLPSEECRVTLTDNEANMILTHAYKKILRVQKELSDKSGNKC